MSKDWFQTFSTVIGVLAIACGTSLAGDEHQAPSGIGSTNETSVLQPTEPNRDQWLDAYLRDQMNYNPQQIAQFKKTVAVMPEEQLRQMLRRIHQTRAIRHQQRELGLAIHQENVDRLYAARSSALSHQAQPAGFAPGSRNIRTYVVNPGSYGLFRGYFVGLGRRF